jgi:DNA polymerase-3 subunit delta
MKITTNAIEGFLRKPDPNVRAVLFHGPDGGLVRERATAFAKRVVPDLNDPFLVSDLGADQLKDDPARLADEAAALALTGGRRVVRVRDVGEAQAKLFEGFLADIPGDALVVVMAGEVKSTGALVKAFEAVPYAAAIACYGDTDRTLDALLSERLRQDQVRIDPDAQQYVLAHLGADRAISRMEIEKLALYAGKGGTLTLEDARILVGDSAALALDDASQAVGEGDSAGLDRAMAAATEAGTSPVGVLRAVGGYLVKLHKGASEVAKGGQPKAIAKSMRIFWKQEDRFCRQIAAWTPSELEAVLAAVLEAEAACKRTGMPDVAVAGRTLHSVCARGRQVMRRRTGR